MRLLIVAAAIVSVAAPAHAMGVYINFEAVAWSRDGKSALVTRSESSSGLEGTRVDYLVITAGREPLTFTMQATRDYDRPDVDTAAAARTFARVAKARGLAKPGAWKVRVPTATELAAIDRAGHALQDEDSFVTANGDLVLEIYGRNGDESTGAHLVAWSRRGSRYIASSDLR